MMYVRRLSSLIILVSFLLLGLYLTTRLFNITSLPIFTDEAIYIRWSQIGSQDANWRFISLTDGKQPLFTWMTMGLLRLVHNPLLAGRLTSVIAGIASVLGIWLVTIELFKRKQAAFLASLIYIISPFALMYDRMALYDSLVAALSLWSLYLGILLVRSVRLDVGLLLGINLGLGMLNKTSGFLSLYLIPFTLVIFHWSKDRDMIKKLVRWIILAIMAATISQMVYSILRLSPFFHVIAQKNTVFVFSISEFMNMPFRFLEGNLRGEFDWMWRYLTLPVFLAALFPLLQTNEWYKEKLLLYSWWIVPVLLLAAFGKVLYPRFVLFMVMPLIVLSGHTLSAIIDHIKNRSLAFLFIFLILLPGIYVSAYIIMDPVHAAIPLSDRGQFIEDWPSGWGVKEVNEYLKEKAHTSNVTVYTEGTFGLLPYAIEIELVNNPNIKIHGIWPLPPVMPQEIIERVNKEPTYLVINESQSPPNSWPLELIFQHQKGNNPNKALRFYKILPIKE